MMINIKSLILVALFALFSAREVLADYSDPTGKTNVNKQTDEFEKSIDDWSGFQGHLEQDKNKAMDSLKGTPEALEFISNKSRNEIEGHAAELNNIKANDLADHGRRKLIESNFLEEIYPDESKPLYIQHKKDADAIAEASSKMLGNLLSMLKDLGVDCRTVKGNKVVEPEYFIDLKKTQTKDTVYNKTICEELRNKYNCTDSVKLSCKKKVSLAMLNNKFVSNLPVVANTVTGYLQVGYKGRLRGGQGTEFNYEISFEVENLSGVREFILKDIEWDDHIHITLNDKQVFAGPIGGDRLELVKRGSSLGWHRVIVDGSGKTYSAEFDTWYQKQPNINLKPYLKEGVNVIKVRLIVAGWGGILIGLQSTIDSCAEWSEEWTEDCRLQ